MTEVNISVEEPKKHFYKDPATLVAIAALIASVLAFVYTYTQTNRQNTATNQQELLTIVGNIAQASATVAQEQATDPGNTNTSEQFGTEMSELANGEEAARFIKLLPGPDITPVEYYLTGLALQLGDNYAEAIEYFGDAADQTADPRTAANALRGEAYAYYQLRESGNAGNEITLAEQAYNADSKLPVSIANKIPGVAAWQYWNNVAYTELFDASFYPTINCPAAVAELDAAETVLSGNSDAVTTRITLIENQDKKNLRSCPQLFVT